jgi:4-methyl-5(b-hydroxyethyl)-thiazole monophosphate biosynthesis
MVYIFLADGFEEIEAVAPIDMLRRAEVNLKIVKVGFSNTAVNININGVNLNNPVSSARDVKILTDMNIEDIDLTKSDDLEMIVLPGGAGGVEHLYNCEILKKIIEHCVINNIKIGAICAAPSILARRGYLKNKKATAHPAFRHYLTDNGVIIPEEKVITEGIFTTAAGAGVSIEFGLELVRVLKGGESAREIGEQILFY